MLNRTVCGLVTALGLAVIGTVAFVTVSSSVAVPEVARMGTVLGGSCPGCGCWDLCPDSDDYSVSRCGSSGSLCGAYTASGTAMTCDIPWGTKDFCSLNGVGASCTSYLWHCVNTSMGMACHVDDSQTSNQGHYSCSDGNNG